MRQTTLLHLPSSFRFMEQYAETGVTNSHSEKMASGKPHWGSRGRVAYLKRPGKLFLTDRRPSLMRLSRLKKSG
jgi:hypothetical protein